MLIRSLAMLLPFALPALAQPGTVVCNNNQGWEITISVPPEGECIVDNVVGEVYPVETGLVCRTADPRQVFLLREDYSFTYIGDEFAYEGEQAGTLIEGECTRA